jgi:superoxide reductase
MDIFSCEKCGILVEALTECSCDAVSCCGQAMQKVEPKTEDQGKEKHAPVIEKIDGGYKVKVGDVPHPMEDDHYIQFVELRSTTGAAYRQELKPGAAPEAVFMTGDLGEVCAVENCNKHGVWIGK